ncbi:MAG: hypothetical protein KA051_02210 [Paludibacteraceae bacterium]|jgi:hypothetical protein|nr:hypothetical protein [Paludibacteraceae bacterium]
MEEFIGIVVVLVVLYLVFKLFKGVVSFILAFIFLSVAAAVFFKFFLG